MGEVLGKWGVLQLEGTGALEDTAIGVRQLTCPFLVRITRSDTSLVVKISMGTFRKPLSGSRVARPLAGRLVDSRWLSWRRAVQTCMRVSSNQDSRVPKSGLPAQLTSLIGREAQISGIRGALRGSRLVTLTGPAGTGKTRLATEVARQLEREERTEVWFTDLTPVRDERLTGKALLAVLGEREQPGRSSAETVAAHLDDRDALLLLDNCEHLVESCAGLALDLLKLAPGLRLLATSRVPLEIPGELRWPVPPLSEEESIDLFVKRACLVSPGFALTPDVSPQVSELCRRLDRLPLAVELAAARMGQFPVDELVARLDRRLSLLVDRGRGIPSRHRTLSAALDWSYDLLDPDERSLFAQLSVFAGGFGLPAAEEVAGAELELLSRLVDKSLLVPARGLDGRARFRLLESVREYAAERLRPGSEAEMTGRRHFEHFSGLASAGASELHGPDQILWLDRLEEEHDNLRAALDWGLRHDAEGAIEMAGAIAWFWNVHGHFSESVRRLKELLAAAPNASTRVRAIGLASLGRLALNLPGRPGAKAALEEALEHWRRLNDSKGLAHALMSRALLGVTSEESRAVCDRLIEEALASAQRADDTHHQAEATAYLGVTAYRLSGDPRTGLRWIERAVELARESGDLWVLAFALDFLGAIRLELRDASTSWINLIEALGIWEALQDPEWLAVTNRLLGEAALARHDPAEAKRRFHTALRSKRLSPPPDFPLLTGPVSVGGMIGLAVAEGQYEKAVRLQGAADALPTLSTAYEKWAVILGPLRCGLEKQPWFEAAIRALGAGRVRSIWEEGRRMTQAEAVAHALDDDDGQRIQPGLLTRREREIAALVRLGLRNRDIAQKLFISERTVDGHLENIREKLGVHSRAEVAVWVSRQGLDDARPPKTVTRAAPASTEPHQPLRPSPGRTGQRDKTPKRLA
jgi:predicted ATPase/DNA-binding CsgD family transcriptional regulator